MEMNVERLVATATKIPLWVDTAKAVTGQSAFAVDAAFFFGWGMLDVSLSMAYEQVVRDMR